MNWKVCKLGFIRSYDHSYVCIFKPIKLNIGADFKDKFWYYLDGMTIVEVNRMLVGLIFT